MRDMKNMREGNGIFDRINMIHRIRVHRISNHFPFMSFMSLTSNLPRPQSR